MSLSCDKKKFFSGSGEEALWYRESVECHFTGVTGPRGEESMRNLADFLNVSPGSDRNDFVNNLASD
jgi:hypothetical protein